MASSHGYGNWLRNRSLHDSSSSKRTPKPVSMAHGLLGAYKKIDEDFRKEFNPVIEQFITLWEWRSKDRRCIFCHALPGRYHQEGCGQGKILKQYVDNLIVFSMLFELELEEHL
jgi:hypothetical protein